MNIANALSPLNLLDISARCIAGKPVDNGDPEPRVKEVTIFRCNVCLELHEEKVDAEGCCAPVTPLQQNRFCPCCGVHHETYRNAADCCLWKSLDAITRWKIADAVEDGSDWISELGLVQFGLSVAPVGGCIRFGTKVAP